MELKVEKTKSIYSIRVVQKAQLFTIWSKPPRKILDITNTPEYSEDKILQTLLQYQESWLPISKEVVKTVADFVCHGV